MTTEPIDLGKFTRPEYPSHWIPTAIYARISEDHEGRSLGVVRQLTDCHGLAWRKQFRVTREFVDNDTSASSRRRRPDYGAMIKAAEAGEIRAIVVWDVDRLTRRPRELEDFIDLADRHGLQLASVGGELDLATEQGRLTARIKGAVARHEAEAASRRIKSKQRELAESGGLTNGGPRPFGYRWMFGGPDKSGRRKVASVELHPEEAPVVREVARRKLEGESLRSLVNDLNARSIATVAGNRWTPASIRELLRSARIAGVTELNGQVSDAESVWPAIVTREQHDDLRAMLDGKRRRTTPGTGRVHLLSGFLVCGLCGTVMTVSHKRGRPKYVCRPKAMGGCERVTIDASGLDEMIVELILSQAERIAGNETLDSDPDEQRRGELTDRITDLERRLERLAEAYADDDDPDPLEMRRAASRLRDKIGEAKDQRSRLAARRTVTVDVDRMRERWPDMDLGRRRYILTAFIESITVDPASPPYQVFDPARVREPVWR